MQLPNPCSIVFFGDSLTRRKRFFDNPDPRIRYAIDYAGSYVDILLKKMLVSYPRWRLRTFNQGVGGDTTQNLLERMDRDVLALEPDLVVLWVGANDSKVSEPEEFRGRFRLIVQGLHAAGCQMLVLNTNPGSTRAEVVARRLEGYEPVIAEVCAEFGARVVDVRTPILRLLATRCEGEPPIQLFVDGVHFTELGNLLVAETVFASIPPPDGVRA